MVRFLLAGSAVALEVVGTTELVLDGRASGQGTGLLLLMLLGVPLGHVALRRLRPPTGWSARALLAAYIDRRQRMVDRQIARYRSAGAWL